MGLRMERESLFGEIEKSIMKENGKMGNVMEKENMCIVMDGFLKGCLIMG